MSRSAYAFCQGDLAAVLTSFDAEDLHRPLEALPAGGVILHHRP